MKVSRILQWVFFKRATHCCTLMLMRQCSTLKSVNPFLCIVLVFSPVDPSDYRTKLVSSVRSRSPQQDGYVFCATAQAVVAVVSVPYYLWMKMNNNNCFCLSKMCVCVFLCWVCCSQRSLCSSDRLHLVIDQIDVKVYSCNPVSS